MIITLIIVNILLSLLSIYGTINNMRINHVKVFQDVELNFLKIFLCLIPGGAFVLLIYYILLAIFLTLLIEH